ncbi:MAG: holo-ACP synthase [Atopobiaceae bacterium]|nr:holo-ACP synthase [Atopobiaceae bacterium]
MDTARTGIDIVEIARMEGILARTPRFRERVFTKEERTYCDASARPATHYACRFAAREAVLKCLGCGFSQGVGLTDVSVVHDASGRPRAKLQGRAAEIAAEQGILEVAISLSFTGSVAIANAVAVTEAVKPHKDETPNPEAELAASFKEARSIMDELERDEFERVHLQESEE